MTTTTDEVRAKVHQLVDQLEDESQLRSALDHLQWLLSDVEVLTEEELREVEEGRKEIERGEYVTLDELKHRLGI